ncbi:metalloprotease PmbA [Flocculibacter collagenilyticus]|uniref:metalloprotease PmbA n=1 Tax=Flocculibacter collagenilyticus TaxID=2744479 RepID=UPI0018F49708|nr:metalloprotease PmbA [Flocculibacter collagenilyticus]
MNNEIIQEINEVKGAVETVLELAKKYGASTAEVAMTRQKGLSVSTRLGEVETVEFNLDGGMGISVYKGQHKGSASTSDLSHDALDKAVKAAVEIARYTSEDDCTGLADKDLLEFEPKDLDLFHPIDVEPEFGIKLCKEMEDKGFSTSGKITNSDGASFSSHQGIRVYGNSHGQIVGYPSSRHSLSCSLIGQQDDEMQRDYAYTVSREFAALDKPTDIGERAALETVSRLGSRKISTRKAPVIFRADVANGLFGHLVAAISGGNLYRKSSFLLDSLGTKITNKTVNIIERPHILKGLASSSFDSEGVKTWDRSILEQGELQTYLLTSYSSRKLKMENTGHAGGIHNWLVEKTDPDLAALLKKMGTGLLVTELMGQGVNIVTGDYSRGCAGFWVENGEIQYPVSEITVAGNLKDMFNNITAIGGDVEKKSSILTGSILIEELQIGGS